MVGDYSRERFKPLKDFSTVLNQQGRVQLDADWNELTAILNRRSRAKTVDIAGRCWVPDDASFKVLLGGAGFTIGPGRIYVDGLLAENHGWMSSPGVVLSNYLKFDPVLAEQTGTFPVPHDRQPYLPFPPPLPQGVPCIVYIDVWEREVTYLEDSELVEQAVGIDTTTRKQTVWQVRVLQVPAGVTCDGEIPVWQALTAPSAGQLTTAAVGVPPELDPCKIPPSGGYRGLENHLYRVEIHDSGPLGTATFTWSRDNASMATNVTGIPAQDTLTVVRTGRDSVMRFKPGDWVEIKDDWLEFTPPASPAVGSPPGKPGVMRQIKDVIDATSTITLYPAPQSQQPLTTLFPVDAQGNLDPSRHTRIILWDQTGKVVDSNGNLIVDLDASGSNPGVIPVPSDPTTSVMLEDGVQVTFAIDLSMPVRQFHIGDYWTFAARTADASVDILQNAPPQGVHHHFGRLALVTSFPGTPAGSGATGFPLSAMPGTDNTLLSDCRCVFSPISPTILDFVSPGECEYTIMGFGWRNPQNPDFVASSYVGWADVLDNHVPEKQIMLEPRTGATVVIPVNPLLRTRREKLGQLQDGARIFYKLSGSVASAVTLQLYKATLPLAVNGTQVGSVLVQNSQQGGPVSAGTHTLAVSMGTALSIASNEAAHMELTCSAGSAFGVGSGATAFGAGGRTSFAFLGALLEYALPSCEVKSPSSPPPHYPTPGTSVT